MLIFVITSAERNACRSAMASLLTRRLSLLDRPGIGDCRGCSYGRLWSVGGSGSRPARRSDRHRQDDPPGHRARQPQFALSLGRRRSLSHCSTAPPLCGTFDRLKTHMLTPRRHRLHFLMRYSDKLFSVDTYAEHKAILDRYGSVWWGKMGVGVRSEIVAVATQQVAANVPTYVYLSNGGIIGHRGHAIEFIGGGAAARRRPKETHLVPSYYRKEFCSVWFRFDVLEPALAKQKRDLVLYNSPSEPPQMRGMRGLVYLTNGRPDGAPVKSMRPRGSKRSEMPTLIVDDDWDVYPE